MLTAQKKKKIILLFAYVGWVLFSVSASVVICSMGFGGGVLCHRIAYPRTNTQYSDKSCRNQNQNNIQPNIRRHQTAEP